MIRKEIEIMPKITLRDRFYFWLYTKVNNTFYKNKMGITAGWWQCGNLDKKAWEYLQKNHKPKKYWITEGYNCKYYKKLKNIKDIVFGVNNLKFTVDEKGRRTANLDLEVWKNKDLYTVANFTFIEQKRLFGGKDER